MVNRHIQRLQSLPRGPIAWVSIVPVCVYEHIISQPKPTHPHTHPHQHTLYRNHLYGSSYHELRDDALEEAVANAEVQLSEWDDEEADVVAEAESEADVGAGIESPVVAAKPKSSPHQPPTPPPAVQRALSGVRAELEVAGMSIVRVAEVCKQGARMARHMAASLEAEQGEMEDAVGRAMDILEEFGVQVNKKKDV
jgi:hypothetical protein